MERTGVGADDIGVEVGVGVGTPLGQKNTSLGQLDSAVRSGSVGIKRPSITLPLVSKLPQMSIKSIRVAM